MGFKEYISTVHCVWSIFLPCQRKRNLDNVVSNSEVNGYWKKNRLKGWFLVVGRNKGEKD